MTSTVHVNNIASSTTESELSSFFSFCGKIISLSLTPVSNEPNAPKSATVTFERPSAAKTAVLLDGTPLNNTPLSVTAAHSLDDLAGPPTSTDEIRQEDKPRTAIFAEYLSQGYEIGDEILNRGIEFDKQHGLTARFSAYLSSVLQTLDEKTHVKDRAKAADSQYHITEKAEGAKGLLARYFEKALGTGPGQKVRAFYETSEKQISEIHAEAKRLAELRKEKKRLSQEFGPSADGKPFGGEKGQTTCQCGGDQSNCPCKEGKCACAGCGKSGVKEAQEKAGPAGQLSHAVEDIKATAADAK